MSDGFLVSDDSYPLIQQAIDFSRRANPFGATSKGAKSHDSFIPRRGYLMQSVSRGGKALCQIVQRNLGYRCWQIDLAGVIYLNHPDGDSKFQLRFTVGADTFDTAILTIEDLTAGKLVAEICTASNGIFDPVDMIAALGHPCQHTNIQNNTDLYPELPRTYNQGDMIDSLIGSWIIGFPRSKLPPVEADFDIDLLFTLSETEPVQLNGPAVMTLHEISDCPTTEVAVVTDIMDVAQPTPLRGGTKVALLPFDDIQGLGIIAANPREYLVQMDFS